MAEDVAGIVDETEGGAGRSGASDVSEASGSGRRTAPETGSKAGPGGLGNVGGARPAGTSLGLVDDPGHVLGHL